jgi:transcriptional regulator of arginine metabolism
MTDGRSRRLRILADLIRGGTVASQEEATAKLKAAGFAVTQATVSRDLESLGAVKLKRGGILSYSLPDQLGAGDWSTGRLERLMGEFVLSIEAAGQMIILKTPPGSAHLVASALDQAQLPDVAGTVSGDDTMFVALRDGVDVRSALGRFARMAGQEEARLA